MNVKWTNQQRCKCHNPNVLQFETVRSEQSCGCCMCRFGGLVRWDKFASPCVQFPSFEYENNPSLFQYGIHVHWVILVDKDCEKWKVEVRMDVGRAV